jgi:hypothetical protein
VRTTFILVLLVAVAGAATYAVVFGPDLGIPSISTGPAPGTTKAAAEDRQASAVPGISGSCASLGAESSSCKQCLSMKLNDCYGPPRPPSLIPTFDCATLADEEIPGAVAKMEKAMAALKARTDAKLDKDTVVFQKIGLTGRCGDDQSYLQDRIKELDQTDLTDTKDALDKAASCLREKHKVAAKRMQSDSHPVLRERAWALGQGAIKMSELVGELNTYAVKASQRLKDFRRHMAVCGG